MIHLLADRQTKYALRHTKFATVVVTVKSKRIFVALWLNNLRIWIVCGQWSVVVHKSQYNDTILYLLLSFPSEPQYWHKLSQYQEFANISIDNLICICFAVVQFKQVILYLINQEKACDGMSIYTIYRKSSNPSKDERRWTFLWQSIIFETTHFTIQVIGSINKRNRWCFLDEPMSFPLWNISILNTECLLQRKFVIHETCALCHSASQFTQKCELFFKYIQYRRQERPSTSNPQKNRRKNELPVLSKGSTRPVDTMDEA